MNDVKRKCVNVAHFDNLLGALWVCVVLNPHCGPGDKLHWRQMLERWSQVDICPPEDPDFRYYTFFFLFYLFLQSPDLNSVLFWIANFVLLLFYFKQPTNLIWSREQSSTTQEVGTRRRFVQFRQLGWWWSLFSVRNLLKTSPPQKKRLHPHSISIWHWSSFCLVFTLQSCRSCWARGQFGPQPGQPQ